MESRSTAPPRLDPATPSTTDEEQTNRRTQRQPPRRSSQSIESPRRAGTRKNTWTTSAHHAQPPRPVTRSTVTSTQRQHHRRRATQPRPLPASIKNRPSSAILPAFLHFPLITPFYNAILHCNAASTIMQSPPRSRSASHDQQYPLSPWQPPFHFCIRQRKPPQPSRTNNPRKLSERCTTPQSEAPHLATFRAHHNPVTRSQLSLYRKCTERGQRPSCINHTANHPRNYH